MPGTPDHAVADDAGEAAAPPQPSPPLPPARDSREPREPREPRDQGDAADSESSDAVAEPGAESGAEPANEPGAVAGEPAPATMEMAASAVRPNDGGHAAPPQIPLAPFKRMQARFNPLADGMMYLVVFVGGFFGTAMRYGLSLVIPASPASSGFLHSFHLATFTANMLACCIFAMLTTYMSQASWIRKRVRQLASRGVGMGMCGGFSTLSAMAIEDLTSVHQGRVAGFMFYTLVSFACGLIVAWLGTRIALVLATKRSVSVIRESLANPGSSVRASAPPSGDYGQPLRHGQATAGGLALGGISGQGQDTTLVPSFEPDPVTDEIPLVADPMRGEAREQ